MRFSSFPIIKFHHNSAIIQDYATASSQTWSIICIKSENLREATISLLSREWMKILFFSLKNLNFYIILKQIHLNLFSTSYYTWQLLCRCHCQQTILHSPEKALIRDKFFVEMVLEKKTTRRENLGRLKVL